MNNLIGGTVELGQVISLTRRSAWRPEYEIRTAVLLCLIGCYLALSELQHKTDLTVAAAAAAARTG